MTIMRKNNANDLDFMDFIIYTKNARFAFILISSCCWKFLFFFFYYYFFIISINYIRLNFIFLYAWNNYKLSFITFNMIIFWLSFYLFAACGNMLRTFVASVEICCFYICCSNMLTLRQTLPSGCVCVCYDECNNAAYRQTTHGGVPQTIFLEYLLVCC